MARHRNGWIKVYRASILGDIGSSYIRQGLFDALLAFANLQPSTVDWNGSPRKLERGELVTSLTELASLGDVDIKTVSRHLNYLCKRDTISIEKTYTGTFIKINNFEQYQGQDAEGSKLSPNEWDNEVQTDGIHNEELKNKRKKEASPPIFSDSFLEPYISKVSNKVQDSWIQAYQDRTFIEMELKKAVTWIHSSPSDAPKSQYSRFFSSWLARSWEWARKQNRGAFSSQSAASVDYDQEAEYFIQAVRKIPEGDLDGLKTFLNDEGRFNCFIKIGRRRIGELPNNSFGKKDLSKLIKHHMEIKTQQESA